LKLKPAQLKLVQPKPAQPKPWRPGWVAWQWQTAGVSLFPLRCGVQQYAWGSPTAMPERFGWPVTGEPFAELWIGAHAVLPSDVLIDDEWVDLQHAIASNPTQWLGSSVVARYGPTLPMLAKVLGIGQPLSLQAHPSSEQAEAGFAREEAAGVDRLSPFRCYRDNRAKPELICALTSMDTLCGFRALDELRLLLITLGGSFAPMGESLNVDDDLIVLVGDLLSRSSDEQATLVAELCRSLQFVPWSVAALLGELAERYPNDAGVVVALLLNHILLEPGQALFLPAGNMHAYLSGLGIEVMASSDNVLRGGLTPKHISVNELLNVLVPTTGPWPVTEPATDGAVSHWSTPVDEVQLWRVIVDGGAVVVPASPGPSLLIVTDGALDVVVGDVSISLVAGAAAYAFPDALVVVRGTGTLWRSTVRVDDASAVTLSA
jgi:mannose-6-phosphate isomerase